MFKVFYSWQSDLPQLTNRNLILKSLNQACKKLKANNSAAVEPIIDRDTYNVAGAVDIASTIFSKILDADAFVADVSLINTDSREGEDASVRLRSCLLKILDSRRNISQRPTPNPNVLVELGYAKHHLGDEAIILVMNTYYGRIEQLPFDLRGIRTITYTAGPNDDINTAKEKLTQAFSSAINSIASVVRGDPVLKIIHPRTMNVVGQAELILRALIKESGKTFDPVNITEIQLKSVCSSIYANELAPLNIIDKDGSSKVANWIEYLFYYRNRSRIFTEDILVFSQFLKKEHVALLATVEQCSYFSMLNILADGPTPSQSLEWLSSNIWKYILEIRKLKEYSEKVLARRVGSF